MKMHVLSGGRLSVRRSIYFPDADRSELVELPVSAFLIRHSQGNALFDTGYHPSAATNTEARWGTLARSMKVVARPDDTAIESLREIAVSPSDIDLVVCSHLHPDHCGCNGFFPKATMMCHALEIEAARAPEAAKMGYLREDWDTSQRIQTLHGQHDVFGDGRMVVVPVPGHTPGSVAALVNLDRDGSFLLASDALPMREPFDDEIMPRNTWNPQKAWESFAEIKRIEAGGATVVCGHDDAQWRTLRKGADAYE